MVSPPDQRTDAEARLPAAARKALRTDIRPKLQAHGGDVRVDDFRGGQVTLSFVGGCRGCAALPMTYLSVVRPILRQLPGITDVNCGQVRVSRHARRRLETLWPTPSDTPEEPAQ